MDYKDKDTTSKDFDLHSFAMDKFDLCSAHYEDLYEAGQYDQEFLYGINQWSQEEVKERKKLGRPCLTLNQLLPMAHQIINDIKQARPSIRISPMDEKADIDTAEIYQGLIRNIERRSNANIAYDTAAMNSVGAGLGWIRINTNYTDPMSFEQEITIERVMNFQSVYIDPLSLSLDGSDSEYAFVFDDIDLDAFKEEYPDAVTTGFDVNNQDWHTDNTIRIAEFFYREYEEIEIVLTDNGVITRAEANLLEEEGLLFEELDTRKAQFPIVKWCKVSGAEVLEESEWVGKYIPLVPVYGEEAWLDGRREFHSLIHQAIDGQKMYNFWKTSSSEAIDMQLTAPVWGAAGSFDSYPNEWANANKTKLAFLEFDLVYDNTGALVAPPVRQPSTGGNPAMMQEAMGAAQDIRNSLGIHEASLGQQGNEISGVAVRNRQIYGDNSNFHFMDNLSASISQVGCILVDLIPRLYNKAMVTRILGEDGTEESVPINQEYIKDKDTGVRRALRAGEQGEGIYNLSAGKYDVVCDVGASYSSKRQEMADKLGELYAKDPALMATTGDLFFKALDMPMGQEIAKRLESQMPPELLGDDPQAARLQQAAKATQQLEEQLNNALAALDDKKKNEQFDQTLKAENAQLERDKFKVEAEKTKADIQKIYSEISKEDGQSQNNIEAVTSQVDDIKQALEILLQSMEEDLDTPEPVLEGEAIESAL